MGGGGGKYFFRLKHKTQPKFGKENDKGRKILVNKIKGPRNFF